MKFITRSHLWSQRLFSQFLSIFLSTFYLIAIFLFRFLPFGFFLPFRFLPFLPLTLRQHCSQHPFNTGFKTVAEISVVQGVRDMLIRFRYGSCFRKYFSKFLSCCHQLVIDYFPLASIWSLFALAILIEIFCNFFILSFKVVLISKTFVM